MHFCFFIFFFYLPDMILITWLLCDVAGKSLLKDTMLSTAKYIAQIKHDQQMIQNIQNTTENPILS